jgi:hypothetical protein
MASAESGKARARRRSVDHHIAYHRLLESLVGSDCALCVLIAQGSAGRIEGLFRELVNDPISRFRLRDSLGYCRRHTVRAADRAGALGLALIYRDIVERLSERLGAWAEKRPVHALSPCPECVAEEADEATYCALLAEYLSDDKVRAAYAGGSGLCIRHMELVMQAASPESRAFVAAIEKARLEALASELDTFIRKSDYRHAHEPFGSEGDAPRRAAAKCVGGRIRPEED